MKNPKIQVLFQGRILWAEFLDKAVINAADIEEIYVIGNEKAKGQKYCVMFEALNHFEVTEDGLQYLLDNPNSKNILEKVYILNTPEAVLKAKLHLLFDHPELKPTTFKTSREGLEFLKDILKKNQ